MHERNCKIDYLRAICSLMIIIAHIDSPNTINQIRSFDVIALVIISGMSLGLKNSNESYTKYVARRIKKLLIPCYALLTFIFISCAVVCKYLCINQLYSKSQILKSYMLLSDGSMGYVWIVRIYLIIALITPVLKRIGNKIQNYLHLLWFLIIGVTISYIIYYYGSLFPYPFVKTVLFDFIYSGWIYSFIATLGYIIIKNNHFKNCILMISGISTLICIVYYYKSANCVFIPGDFKYPPTMYYCAYGIFISLILYSIVPNINSSVIRWLSQNSYSIYLWHIFVLRFYGFISKIHFLKFLKKYWWVEYLIVTILAILATAVWNTVLSIIKNRQREEMVKTVK